MAHSKFFEILKVMKKPEKELSIIPKMCDLIVFLAEKCYNFPAMIVTDQVTDKLQKLPIAAQEEVLDFVEFLLEKSVRRDRPFEQDEELNGEQKARVIEQWAKSRSFETPVILDDRREAIYED